MVINKSLRIFTIPNFISMARILLLIPVAIYLWNDNLVAVGILAFISVVSDFFDGWFARRFNQISDFGKILDPLGDKLSIGVIIIILCVKKIVPLWLVIVIVSRDLAILIGGLWVAHKYNMMVTSNFIGKITVNVLAATVVVYIFDFVKLQNIFSTLTVFFVVLSSYSYFRRYLQIIREEEAKRNAQKIS